MKDKQDDKPFQLPESILTQLNEFSNGGFILFRMGEGQNPPEVFLSADNPIISIGLIDFVKMWANAVQSVNEDMIQENIIGDGDGEEDGDDEDFY